MKNVTRSKPTAPAMRLLFTESRPSVGSTREDWITSSETGSAPELISRESSFADCVVNCPSMIPRPDVKTTWIVGAEICFPSSEIWTGLLREALMSWTHRSESGPGDSEVTSGRVAWGDDTDGGVGCS